MRKALLAVSGAALVVLALTGCSHQMAETNTPVRNVTGYDIRDIDMSTFSVTLPSGREIECVAVTFNGSAIQCFEVGEAE